MKQWMKLTMTSKLGCDDFICNIMYSFNVIRLIHDYTVTQ